MGVEQMMTVMVRVSLSLALAMAAGIGMLGCVQVRPVPSAESTTTDYRVPRPRDEVFDAAVSVGQRMNLDVPVLEKGSGFLRFEWANVNAAQLDKFCQFPYVDKDTGRPSETFSDWADAGNLAGIIQLVLVMSPDGPAATNVAIRARCRVVAPGEVRPRGYTNVYANDCNSLGALEKEFIAGIETALRLR